MLHESRSNLKSQKSAKWLEKAVTYQRAGDLQRAADHYRRYLRDNPGDAGVLHTLGGLFYEMQDYQSAGEFLEKAHKADPGNPDFLNDLGAFRLMKQDYLSAISCLQKLAEKLPDNAQVHYNIGLAMHGAGKLAEAIAAFEQVIRLQPDFAAAHYNLGITFQGLGHYPQAEDAFRKAIRLKPDLAQAYCKLGEVLTKQRNDDEALEIFRRAYALDNDDQDIIKNLVMSLLLTGKSEEGISLLQGAINKHPQTVSLMAVLGEILVKAGKINEAEAIYRQALSLQQDNLMVLYDFSRIRKFSTKDADIIERMETLIKSDRLHDIGRTNINFALGKIYDDCGEYDKAFAHYYAGNTIRHKRMNYDREAHERHIDDLISVFSRSFYNEFSHLGTKEELPVFIIGMPRSGTTLTEQIIASHPEVKGAGELTYFPSLSVQLAGILGNNDAWPFCCRNLDKENAEKIIRHYLDLLRRHSHTARFVTDKFPGNYIYFGLIRLLFPMAPIIHCCRDSLDVCLSIFFQNFQEGHDYSYDLTDIGHRYQQYARLMAHWRRVLSGPLMEIQYEDLVSQQEVCSRALIEFCGLDWNDACIDFYRSQRDINTSSNWQVRQPIYRESAGRWKHYEKYLQPLMKLFEDASDEL